ncbi:MAG TPA: lanthionine synthetase C family protein [Thermoanaerobaculia bacterium]|jgi:lantibiotic modifying enzyme
MTTWRPILEGPAAEHALRVVEEIAADLREGLARPAADDADPGFRRGPSLAGGDAGLALFYSYLDRVRPGQGCDDTAMELLERAIEATGEVHAPPSLYGGFSGVAWALEHLRGRLFEDDEEGEDAGDEVAAALFDHLGLTPWRGQYDLISGLVGFGVYALERLPRAGGRECLERVVTRLAETAERGPGTVTWRTSPDLLIERDAVAFPEGNYNLGVAHGVPGAIALLAQACAAGLDARDLVDGAVAWLLAQKLPAEAGSVFSYNVAPGVGPTPARLAWCYGDLGIAAALLAAARAVGEEGREREALEIARQAANRPTEVSGVVDAGICHGAAGAAHLFNRLHQATGDPLCREAALRWLDRTLSLRRPGEGVGGFLAWTTSGSGEELAWRPEAGFLTGAAGVGLALLAAAAPVEPEWDRVLLAAVR